jgi:hypothetical protein
MRWVVNVTPWPRFIPGERTSSTHWKGGWVGPRADLNTGVVGKILCFCRGSNPDRPVVQSVIRKNTDWATPAPTLAHTTNYYMTGVYRSQEAADLLTVILLTAVRKQRHNDASCNISLFGSVSPDTTFHFTLFVQASTANPCPFPED